MAVEASYDGDLALWAKDQARALRDAGRARVNLPIDWENVAEEIEAFGKSQGRELASRIRTILVHLVKLQCSPAMAPHAGWRATIRRERAEVETLLHDSPSLRPNVPTAVAIESAVAVRIAAADMADFGEQPKIDPASLQYSPEQILGDWFPA
jgi:hypothetical protein